MLISMNWISEFVNLDGVDKDELISRFTLSTAEVEEVHHYGNTTQNVVVAKICTVSDHPTSKKLHILSVDDGTKTVAVVCGAPNVREGMLVAFARDGGCVNGQAITACEVAGIMSNGMCCSESELGISDNHGGIMELDGDIPLGSSIKELFPLDDIVFEVDNKSLTNRPDLWGHYGIAREIAALCGRPLLPISVANTDCYSDLPPVSINVSNAEKCLRYTGLVMQNVTRRTSPLVMKIRLFYCGMRSINLLADLTNYVMLELGQPMHAFDNKIVDKITVRTFESELDFKTLDGSVRKVPRDTLLICHGDNPVAIAGVMGGENSEITDDTTSILLESANFDGVCVRKTSTALGLRTEASARYEKVLDPELTLTAAKRFLLLLQAADSGVTVASSLTDCYGRRYPNIELSISKAYIDKYTGIEIEDERIVSTLQSLGFGVTLHDSIFSVTVPSFRATKDVSIKADLIEEITRIYGYDNFVLKTSNNPIVPVRHSVTHENEYAAKLLLAEAFSLNEVHSYIWNDTKSNKELGITTRDNVKIINSVASETSVLRTTISPMLLSYANLNKSAFSEMGFFEIGRVIKGVRADGLCDERKVLSILVASKSNSEKQVFMKAKSILETLCYNLKRITPSYSTLGTDAHESFIHPYNSSAIVFEGTEVGFIAMLHPLIKDKIDKKLNIALVEFEFDTFSNVPSAPFKFNEISRFPGVEIDLSFLVSTDISYNHLTSYLSNYHNEFLTKIEFVDVYEDSSLASQKSITLRFSFGSNDRTLLGEEVSGFKQDIIDLMSTNGAFLR